MAVHTSDLDLLVLHAVRLKGMTTPAAAAGRFALARDAVQELLLDFAALGWVRHENFAGTGGWSLTESGRVENERRLRAELELAAAAPALARMHSVFLPLNARLQSVMTRWQIRPLPGDELAANDHTDFRWDARVLEELALMDRQLARLVPELSSVLSRFDGYDRRFHEAAAAARRGQRQWVDGLDIDSCHRVWFELHEDLLATLGLHRGSEAPST